MKRMIFYFIVFLLSVSLGLVIKYEPGYFLVVVNKYSIEMPLWIGAFALVFTFVLFHYSINAMQYMLAFNVRIRNWFKHRRLAYSHSYSTRSLLALSEGQWVEAEKFAVKAIPNSDCQLIDYLIAARAAQHQGAIDRRDRFLRQAKKIAPQEKIAVELTQAQLQIEAGQYEQALALVQHLYQLLPKHHFIIKLLFQLYEKLEDWQSLQALLPAIYKSNILSNQEYNNLEQKVYYKLLSTAVFADLDDLEDFWHQLPKAFKRQSSFVLVYVKWLNQFNETKAAETNLKMALKRQLDNDLIESFGKVIGPNPESQLAMAEHWLQQEPRNAVLLATLARLSSACEYWGKAKAYFNESLALKEEAEVAAEYAALLEQTGETEQAFAYYKRALELDKNISH